MSVGLVYHKHELSRQKERHKPNKEKERKKERKRSSAFHINSSPSQRKGTEARRRFLRWLRSQSFNARKKETQVLKTLKTTYLRTYIHTYIHTYVHTCMYASFRNHYKTELAFFQLEKGEFFNSIDGASGRLSEKHLAAGNKLRVCSINTKRSGVSVLLAIGFAAFSSVAVNQSECDLSEGLTLYFCFLASNKGVKIKYVFISSYHEEGRRERRNTFRNKLSLEKLREEFLSFPWPFPPFLKFNF